MRADGTVCFASSTKPRDIAERRRVLKERIDAIGDAEIRKLAVRLERRDGKPAAEFKGAPKPACSYHSEALQTSVLRSDWSAGAAQLAVDWSSPEMRLDFSLGKSVVACGSLPVNVVVDGKRREPIGQWEEVLWESDGDVDYLEIEIALSCDVQLQRQFILTRRDGQLFVADAVLAKHRAGRIECEVTLPLADGVQFSAEKETRDGTLTAAKRPLAVIPPALPEWRVDRRVGELASVPGLLTLRQSAERAVALFAPLSIVFDPARARRERTWRQLTIGEGLQLQPADRAVGYRVQIGREHWLLYRSLTPRANRTVLGVNLQTNFLFARFKSDGSVDNLIEIDD
jgi:hypothetical protein